VAKAIFLDRDGVINEDFGYVHRVEDFRFLPGVFEALRHFKALGYKLILITNQSGIGRGYYSEEDFHKLTKWMQEGLEKEGVRLDAIYYCPHHPRQGCECRKPQPGMLLQAIKEQDIDAKSSWMIGDKPSDIEAAKRAGIDNTILLEPNSITSSLFDTIKIIEGKSHGNFKNRSE